MTSLCWDFLLISDVVPVATVSVLHITSQALDQGSQSQADPKH